MATAVAGDVSTPARGNRGEGEPGEDPGLSVFYFPTEKVLTPFTSQEFLSLSLTHTDPSGPCYTHHSTPCLHEDAFSRLCDPGSQQGGHALFELSLLLQASYNLTA